MGKWPQQTSGGYRSIVKLCSALFKFFFANNKSISIFTLILIPPPALDKKRDLNLGIEILEKVFDIPSLSVRSLFPIAGFRLKNIPRIISRYGFYQQNKALIFPVVQIGENFSFTVFNCSSTLILVLAVAQLSWGLRVRIGSERSSAIQEV